MDGHFGFDTNQIVRPKTTGDLLWDQRLDLAHFQGSQRSTREATRMGAEEVK